MELQPRIVDLPEMKMVGPGTRFISILSPGKNNATVNPQLWDTYMKRLGEIKNRKDEAAFGLVEMLPASAGAAKGEMYYLACAQVSEFGSVPAGLEQRTVPAGKYAKFTHKGKLDGLGATMKAIYEGWLPKSGKRHRDAPDIEIYDQRFDINSDQSEFDILIPVA